MNVEKTIEFILDMQAKAEERFAKAEERASRADRRMDRLEASIAQTNRVVKLMAGAGRSLRSDVGELQRWRADVRHWQARTEQNLAEITEKLDALIDVVDKSIRRNGGNGKR